MKIVKKLVASLMIGTMCIGGMVGCAQGDKTEGSNSPETSKSAESGEASKTDELKEVKLTWYYRAEPMVDQDKVFEEANKIVKEEINATVDFVPIAPGEYDQKMQTKYAAGDAGDITWASSWTNNYAQNIAKGAFIPIDNLLNEYAPTIKNSMPEEHWKALQVEGETYGIPNIQLLTKTDQTRIRKDYADKYGLNPSEVVKLEDLEPWLTSLRAAEAKEVVYEWNGPGRFNNLQNYYGFDVLGSIATIKTQDDTLKVMNIYEAPEFEENLKLAKRWVDAGYIADDGMTKKDQEAERKAGKIIGDIRGNYKPGAEADAKDYWGTDMYVIPLSEPVITTGGITSTINSITTSSKNPERAMMFLELLNSNAELYNLISFGIEGEHYEVIGENTIKFTENASKYKVPNWLLGNITNGYLIEGQSSDTWTETLEMNKTAKESPALGFTFDIAPVKTQVAQVQTVVDEYLPGLGCGVVDIDTVLPEFRQKLKSAGADEIVAEAQKQIDEWAKNNK